MVQHSECSSAGGHPVGGVELHGAGGDDPKLDEPIQIVRGDAGPRRPVFNTSRGRATAPAWEFSLAGSSVIVTRIAVAAQDEVSVAPPPWDSNDPPVGLSVESATGKVGARQLTVAFTGAQAGAEKPCGADYATEAVESDTAVVVIVIGHLNLPVGAGCEDVVIAAKRSCGALGRSAIGPSSR